MGSKPYHLTEKKYLNWNESGKYLQSLGIKTNKEFRELKKLGVLPENFPPNPPGAYKNIWKEKDGWSGYLNSGNRAYRNYIDFKNLHNIISKKKFNSKIDYGKWGKSIEWSIGKKDIPSAPNVVYKRSGHWKGWADFLGKED